MNKEELQKQCASLSDKELLSIINYKIGYTELIVTAAQIELSRRGLSKEEVNKHKKALDRQSKKITGNIVEDIHVMEKVLFFFLFLPRLSLPVRRSYRRDKYVLKLKQASYYSLLGFVSFLLILIFGVRRIPLLAGTIIWVLSFLATYAFNQYYYKEKTIQRLKMLTARQEEEEKNVSS